MVEPHVNKLGISKKFVKHLKFKSQEVRLLLYLKPCLKVLCFYTVSLYNLIYLDLPLQQSSV